MDEQPEAWKEVTCPGSLLRTQRPGSKQHSTSHPLQAGLHRNFGFQGASTPISSVELGAVVRQCCLWVTYPFLFVLEKGDCLLALAHFGYDAMSSEKALGKSPDACGSWGHIPA